MEERIQSLESKFNRMADDINGVKNAVDRIERALTGDAMTTGAIPEFRERIKECELRIANVNTRLDHQLTLTELSDTRSVISWFKGWKLVIASMLYLLPLIALILNQLNK
jgi:predicted RNase H-like nuclease (RuvC/YqgF family)